MRRLGGLASVGLLLALLLGPPGCGPAAEPRPGSNTSVTVAVDEPAAIAPAATPAPVVAMGPSQRGFTFCCGDGHYKIEIACDQMLKRCYERDDDGSWDATYGRHCKRRLGDQCYLSACDERCR